MNIKKFDSNNVQSPYGPNSKGYGGNPLLFNSGGAGTKVKPGEFGLLGAPGHTYTEGNQSVAGQSHHSAGNKSH